MRFEVTFVSQSPTILFFQFSKFTDLFFLLNTLQKYFYYRIFTNSSVYSSSANCLLTHFVLELKLIFLHTYQSFFQLVNYSSMSQILFLTRYCVNRKADCNNKFIIGYLVSNFVWAIKVLKYHKQIIITGNSMFFVNTGLIIFVI